MHKLQAAYSARKLDIEGKLPAVAACVTLAEIAEYFHISRQAVHDAMRHGEEQLAGYEKALRMLSRKKQKAKAAEKLLTLLTDRQKEEAAPLLELLAE